MHYASKPRTNSHRNGRERVVPWRPHVLLSYYTPQAMNYCPKDVREREESQRWGRGGKRLIRIGGKFQWALVPVFYKFFFFENFPLSPKAAIFAQHTRLNCFKSGLFINSSLSHFYLMLVCIWNTHNRPMEERTSSAKNESEKIDSVKLPVDHICSWNTSRWPFGLKQFEVN